jgi:hypothetical protein
VADSICLPDVPTDRLTDSLVASIAAAATALGLPVHRPSVGHEVQRDAWVLAVGPPAYYRAFMEHVEGATRIAWFGEPLPRAAEDDSRGSGSSVASRLPRVLRPLRDLPLPGRLALVRSDVLADRERQRNLEQVMEAAAVVERLVTTSRDRALALKRRGVHVDVVPYGYHSVFAGPMTADGDRDIDVLVLAGLGSTGRRAHLLPRVLDELGHGVRIVVTDDRWGRERDALLRRARVLLDVHRVSGNFVGLRLVLAAAAGAVLVTDPMDDPHPFIPGTHHVEAPTTDLAHAATELLADEPRRVRMVQASQALIAGELSMRRSLERVIS